jgi:hypothetical protein
MATDLCSFISEDFGPHGRRLRSRMLFRNVFTRRHRGNADGLVRCWKLTHEISPFDRTRPAGPDDLDIEASTISRTILLGLCRPVSQW